MFTIQMSKEEKKEVVPMFIKIIDKLQSKPNSNESKFLPALVDLTSKLIDTIDQDDITNATPADMAVISTLNHMSERVQ